MGGRFRIGISLTVGVAILASAYFLRHNATADSTGTDPRDFVATPLLRQYQDNKDTDGDGMPDWLEELSGTDPRVNNTASTRIATSTASTTKFVADTATKKFAVSFFENVLATHGGKDLTDQEKKAILDKSLQSFTALNQNTLYTRNDLRLGTLSDGETVRTYGNTLARAILSHNTKPKGVETELVILGRAVQKDDPALLKDLVIIKKNYMDMADAVRAVEVPPSAIESHLILINALRAIAEDIAGFELAISDPLVSYVRVKRYPSDVEAMAQGLIRTRKILEQESIVYQKDEAGAFFFSLRP